MSSNPALLIELDPVPKCCLDANDFGIFVVSGKNDNGLWKIDLSTLSTIHDHSHAPYPLPLDVEERLLLASQQVYEDVPLLMFLEQCKAIFSELITVLIRTQNMEPDEPHDWSLDQLLDLQQQLTELESNYGETCIQLLSNDLNLLRLQYVDTSCRFHVLELNLTDFPSKLSTEACEPDVSHITEVFQKFILETNQHQRAYQMLDELDSQCVTATQQATFERCIQIPDTATTMLLTLDPIACSPKSVQFIGEQSVHFEDLYRKYRWSNDLSIMANLEQALSIPLSSKHGCGPNSENTLDCAICYCRELETKFPTELCDHCGRPYHLSCLREWLQSLSTPRVSFDRLIGACLYCQEPISVSLDC